jgi:hypothetical protein
VNVDVGFLWRWFVHVDGRFFVEMVCEWRWLFVEIVCECR